MRYASVIVDIPTQALDTAYTYAADDSLTDLEVGCAVVVPFGGRRAVGFVIELSEVAEPDLVEETLFGEAPLDSNIKFIHSVVSRPYFNKEGAACAQWMAHRYVAPLSSCVRLFTPPGGVPKMVRNAGGFWQLEQPSVGEVDDRWVTLDEGADTFEPRKGAVKQAAIVDALRRGDVRVAELAAEYGSVNQALRSLESKGVVRVERRRRMRSVDGEDEYREKSFVPSTKPELTEGQIAALQAINDAMDAADGSVVVVDGVTGSGKTEVYLQAIERVLQQGKNAIVLVSEISLTPQTVARFRGRFGGVVAVMHSRMSQGERFDQWDYIRSGQARVVVGARSALFTPLDNVGLIVIDEEHESSYKQDSAPRYTARDVAIWLARRSGAAVVLGSATPSIEALHAAMDDPQWTRVELPDRANGRSMPGITVVDMAAEFSAGHRSMFSRPLAKALEEELTAGHKAVLLLNQRGFARFMLCRDCGYVPVCESCSTSLTYHESSTGRRTLMCHHCGHSEPAPVVCPVCGGPYLRLFGAGTQRVEQELHALIESFEGPASHAEIIRMDADTTTRKGGHQRLLEQFARADAAVLLGTQMIAKGLDFHDVTVVGVINADTMLKLPDYRAAERTFALIQQVAGRAGRAELPGQVFVQTYEAQALPIRAAAAYRRDAFLEEELVKRRLLQYPPYARMANVLVWGQDEKEVAAVAKQLGDDLANLIQSVAGPAWSVLPATPCALSKLRKVHRWHIIVRSPADEDLSAVLDPFFRERKPHKTVNCAVDIDPLSLL